MINQRRVKQKLFNVQHFRLLSRTHHCILVILQMVAHHLPYVGQCLYDHPLNAILVVLSSSEDIVIGT
jgi:hypothetical protein